MSTRSGTLYIARLGGELVGTVLGDPAPAREHLHRRDRCPGGPGAAGGGGGGGALLEYAESVAAGRGRTSLDAYCEIPLEQVERAAGLLPAKSGAGGLPRDEAVNGLCGRGRV